MTSEVRPLPASIFKAPSLEQQEQAQRQVRRRAVFLKAVWGTVSTIITIAAAATLVAAFALPIVKISDDSAEPVLKNGSVIILLKTDKPQTGDICGFSWNGKTLIRQIAAVPGDTVDMADGTLIVNGERLYSVTADSEVEFPFQVPQESFLTVSCGDEKTVESFGDSVCIAHDTLIGRAVCCVYPQPRLITRE